ncbi:hypothetical protein J4210_02545 [Candidatus Woesearchaeota archaeon]|nr:hypothetical protein [Candidatus Woesearchaeota archaeon]
MNQSKLLEKFGFKEEVAEIIKGQFGPTGFPEPLHTWRMMWEVYDLSLEEPYFWILDNIKGSMPIVEKLEDSFAAAENSAFFGVTQQRLGAQQDRVSQFLATMGKMVKELFQMVRELRIIDERLNYYAQIEEETTKPIEQRAKGPEITLKGMFVDLVQGGGKSAASVYGMARELEFITLPDLFFDAPPFAAQAELEKHVNALARDFNENVLRVLKRHLTQYFSWRQQTSAEHRNRKTFMLQYLLQHYEIIRMYITWVKPYLRNVRKLSLNEGRMDSPEMVSAFEGSMLDVEFLARKRTAVKDPEGKYGGNGCILATFTYRTRPELKVVQEGYQRGPVHIGRVEFALRVYSWTDEQVEQYKKVKDEELLNLLGDISETVRTAMESLGDALKDYVEEARKNPHQKAELTTKRAEKMPKKPLMERFFGDFYTPKKKETAARKGYTAKEIKAYVEKAEAAAKDNAGFARFMAWNTYKNFKKAHRMFQW